MEDFSFAFPSGRGAPPAKSLPAHPPFCLWAARRGWQPQPRAEAEPADAEEDIDWLTLQPKKPATSRAGGSGRLQNVPYGKDPGQKDSKKAYRQHLASEGVRGATRGADDKREATIAQIEASMMQLNIDRDAKKMELEKIPDNAKTIAQIRRRDFLEKDLKTLGSKISSLKNRLRDMGELHTSYNR